MWVLLHDTLMVALACPPHGTPDNLDWVPNALLLASTRTGVWQHAHLFGFFMR